jgi:glutathione/glutaredoxin type arsenate reductase
MQKVLFVCIENSCRSQIAEGFARSLGKDVIEAYSAGSKPSGKVNPDAIKVMREAGIDISLQESKGFSDLTGKNFDYVITLGCGDACPFVPADKHIEWKIENPMGKDLDFFRQTRDEIRDKVINFIEKEA